MKEIFIPMTIYFTFTFFFIMTSEDRITSTVKAEIQKLTPVISEGRAYFSGVCVEPKEVKE